MREKRKEIRRHSGEPMEATEASYHLLRKHFMRQHKLEQARLQHKIEYKNNIKFIDDPHKFATDLFSPHSYRKPLREYIHLHVCVPPHRW